MIITRVRVVRFRVPFREPYVTAAGRATDREGFIVQLGTENGLSGVGEASLLPHESGVEALGEALRGLATQCRAGAAGACLRGRTRAAVWRPAAGRCSRHQPRPLGPCGQGR